MKKRPAGQILLWFMVMIFAFGSLMPAKPVFAADPLPGNTYYVAVNGDDSNPGTKDAPFASIIYAYQKLASGDTLLIRGGTYKGFLQIINKQDVTIKNYDGEKVVIQDCANAVGYLAYVGGDVENDGTPKTRNAVISGISFAFANGENGVGMYIDPSSGVKVANCEFTGGEGGIVARAGAEHADISCNVIHECGWPYGGILLFNSASNKVYNNIIYKSYFGVHFYGANAKNSIIINNTFYNNNFDIGASNVQGIASGNIFRNNIFSSQIQNRNHDNPDALVDNFMSLNSFDYNCYNSTTLQDGIVTNDGLTLEQLKALGTPAEANGFAGDPRFLNAATDEFQTGKGSCCIGKGTTTDAPALDILGQAQSNPPDVGAYLHAERTNYYVAANGDDANAGTDAAPFKTIAYALNAMQSGDSLFIKGGTYAEAVTITSKAGISLKNYQAEQPVLTKGINITTSSGIVLSGFNLDASSVVVGDSRNVTVTNMDINGGHIVIVPGDGKCTDGYEISSNRVHGFQGEGAILVYNGRNGSIINNLIYDNKNQGILLEGGECANNKLYNNTLYSNGSDLLLVYAPSIGNPGSNTFRNNIFSNGLVMGSYGFYKTNVFDYNFYNKTVMTDGIGAGYSNVYNEKGEYVETQWPALADMQAEGVEPNGFFGAPEFINPLVGDFRLSIVSEGIGKGTSEGAPQYDFRNTRRDGPYDVGAYKFTGEISDFYVSADGNDANAGTKDAPFKTIQNAVNKVGTGGTVYIMGGTYNESLNISGMKGSASNPFTIRSVAGETVILSSGDQKETAVTIGGKSAFWKIEDISIKNYTKNGIEIKGEASNITLSNVTVSDIGENAVFGENSSNVTVSDCIIGNTKNGLSLTASTGWSIERTMIDRATGTAAGFAAGSSNNTLSSSVLVNSGTGMKVSGSGSLIVYNNDFFNNAQSDMKLEQASSGSTIRNNIFGSAGTGYLLEIADEGSLGNTFDYNCYNKKSGAAVVNYTSALTFEQFKALGKETCGIQADPMFTDPANGDYILKPGSPCALKGIKDSNTPAAGYDGEAFGTPMDIGAFFSPYSLKSYYVAVDGDDSNDGSIQHPWKTIKKGMTSMKQSDTLYIRGGVYNERIDLYDMNGRPYTCFTVKNYNSEKVLLDSEFSQDVGIKFSNCSYWKVEGINFTRYVGAAIWTASGSEYITMEKLEISNIDNPAFVDSGTEGILGDGGSNCTVRNCYIHDIGQTRKSQADHGIYIGYGSHGWVFDSNRIDKSSGSGIQLYGKPVGGDDCIIENNVISNCKYGLILTMGKRNIISNNTFVNNWEYDLYMDWWFNDSIIQNNIFYNDLPKGMLVKVEDRANKTTRDYEINPVPLAFLYEQVCSNIFRNNMLYNKKFGSRVVEGNTIKPLKDYLETQNLNTIEKLYEKDPKFVDADKQDFRLQSNSKCIDEGVSEHAPVTDISGQNRVDMPDLGAYEYRNSAPPAPKPTPDPTIPEPETTPKPTAAPTPTPTPTPTPKPTPSVTPPTAAPAFTDIEGNWANKAIVAMAKAGVLTGYGDGTARPGAKATRAEFVTMVIKLMKQEAKTTKSFTDTASSAWYAKALSAAVEKGWIGGGTDGSFRPDDAITREEAFVIISRILDSLGVKAANSGSGLDAFKDGAKISKWVKEDVEKLIRLGIVKGSDGMLNSKAPISRAEICRILSAIMENYLK